MGQAVTVPAGAKIIANKFQHRCFQKDGMVGAGDGAAILDVNITGKWETFHLTCLPAPYEKDDIRPAYTGPRRHYSGPVTPEHQRCASAACAHWRLDHATGVCVGSFNGRQCGCTQFIEPSVVPTAQPLVTFTPKTQAEIDAEIERRNKADMAAIIAESVRLAPEMSIAPTIVCFYGPIKSATDGQQHFIYPQDIAHLHGIDADIMAATHVQFVSPEQKATWRPPTIGDVFIIGPRFTVEEYEQSKAALHNWLEEKGVI